MSSDDDEAGPTHRTAVPAAFYRDTAPPPPAKDDPHWAEFGDADGSDSLPEWMLLAGPAVLLGFMALHGVLAVLLWFFLLRR